MQQDQYLKNPKITSVLFLKKNKGNSIIIKLAIFFSFVLILSFFFYPIQAQTGDLPVFTHMQNTILPFNSGISKQLAPLPPAPSYDEQLGITFTEQNIPNLSYNVTALPQTDADGYGPANLLNGASNDNYWYQVGISYNWPYLNGGYTAGFNLNYEVFNSSGNSIYPGSGGGLSPFPGVRSGDLILLNLNITNGIVYMYAKDWNTSMAVYQTYVNNQTSYFVGNSQSASNKGVFTGLMTEWWHVNPYSGQEVQVTYSNYDSPISSAWMWMDEWEPGQNWLGNWSVSSYVTYSNPSQLQSLSSHGAIVYSNAYLFISGSLISQTTTITLLPAIGSTALSNANQFTVYSTLLGLQQVNYAQNGTLTLLTDNATIMTISAISNGSSSNEKWALNSQLSNITIPSGSNNSFYYYDLLNQQVSYNVSGGGNPANPILTYTTAPPIASGQLNQTTVPTSLSQSPQSILVLKETTASVSSPINGTAQEQWSASTTTWNVIQANQISNPITYYHQYQITANYTTTDGSVSSSNINLIGTQSGKSYQTPLSPTSQSIWLDVNTVWSSSSTSTSSSGYERWASVSGNSGTVTGLISISPSYAHQFYLTVISSYGHPLGSGWYNNGSTAYASLTFNAVLSGTDSRYTLSGWGSDSSGTGMISNGIIMNSPKTATALWQTQYYLTVTSPFGQSNPESGWFATGTIINDVIPSSLSPAAGKQYICIGWTGTGSVVSSGSSSSTTFTINEPSSIIWNWKTRYYLNVSANFGSITPSDGWLDAGTIINMTAVAPSVQQGERYAWNGWSGNIGDEVHNNAVLLTINEPINATASWVHQYLVTVNSPYGSPSPSTSWFNAGANATFSVDSPVPESIVSQHLSTGWLGTGSAPASGMTTNLNFVISQSSSITWIWKSQWIISNSLLVIGVPLILIAALSIYLLKFKKTFRKPKLS